MSGQHSSIMAERLATARGLPQGMTWLAVYGGGGLWIDSMGHHYWECSYLVSVRVVSMAAVVLPGWRACIVTALFRRQAARLVLG